MFTYFPDVNWWKRMSEELRILLPFGIHQVAANDDRTRSIQNMATPHC
jgi:hypothetical protein